MSPLRVHKPRQVGYLHRSYEVAGEHFLALKPMFFFKLSSFRDLLEERNGWISVSKCLPARTVLDPALPKGKTEVLLVGQAYSPSAKPVNQLLTRVSVGGLNKPLRILGDRIWQKRWIGWKKTSAALFQKMPIEWARSYGELGSQLNPDGLGSVSSGSYGEKLIGLPNITYPNEDLKKPSAKIRSAGYGPLEPHWGARAKYAGAFDAAYLREQFPALPTDVDFRLYNQAPEDQWLSHLDGNEEFCLENLHPERPLLEGRLPAVRPRVLCKSGSVTHEVELAIETLWSFPGEDLGVIIYRGVQSFGSFDPLDIGAEVLIAYEWSEQKQRSIDYYEQQLQQRTSTSSFASIPNDCLLKPEKSPAELEQKSNTRERELKELSEGRKEEWIQFEREYNLKAREALPQAHEPNSFESDLVVTKSELREGDFSSSQLVSAAEVKAKAEQQRAATDLRDKTPSAGKGEVKPLSDDEILQLSLKNVEMDEAQNPDSFKSSDVSMGDELSRVKLRELELASLCLATAPSELSRRKREVSSQVLRSWIQDRIDRGESLSCRDFTGVDCSNMDFSNLNFAGSIFEAGDFSNTNFQNCNLAGCSFLGANIDGAKFDGALLENVNLSWAKGVGTSFKEATLSGTSIFENMELVDANFSSSKLTSISLQNSKLVESDFSSAAISGTVFLNSSLSMSKFNETKLKRTNFVSCSLSHTSWVRSEIERSSFVAGELQFSVFSNTTMFKSALVKNTSATALTLERCQFTDCGFRGLLATAAQINECEFYRCDLGEVCLRQLVAQKTYFNECQMPSSNLAEADLSHCVFANSSLAKVCMDDCELAGVDFSSSDVLTASFRNASFEQSIGFSEIKSSRIRSLEVA